MSNNNNNNNNNHTEKVPNLLPAQVQVSADQILKDAFQNKKNPSILKPTDYKITDAEELKEYQSKIRSSYEKALQFKRSDIPQYIRYAKWEWELKNYQRARSIFERGLKQEHKNVKLWLEYINLEIKDANINHARNLLERSITVLPKVDKFYFEYLKLEESLKNFNNCQEIFKRWINWSSKKEDVFDNYIAFLIKYHDFDEARFVFEDLVKYNPSDKNLAKFIEFEQEYGDNSTVTILFNLFLENLLKATTTVDSKKTLETILRKYAEYESRFQKNTVKAKQLYQFGISQGCDALLQDLTSLEKQHPDEKIDQHIFLKRRLKYEEELDSSNGVVDPITFWDYLDLLQNDLHSLTSTDFEKYIENLDLTNELTFLIWRRYLNFEELESKDIQKTRQIFSHVTSKKKYPQDQELWIKYAEFEIRQGDLSRARKIFGYCLGRLPTADHILKRYVELERSLKCFDRVRKIYETYLSKHSQQYIIWCSFIEFEKNLKEFKRCEEILNLVFDIFQRDGQYKDAAFTQLIDFYFETFQFSKIGQKFEQYLKINDTPYAIDQYALTELKIPNAEQLKEIERANNTEDEFEFEITDSQISKAKEIYESNLSRYAHLSTIAAEEKRVLLFQYYKKFVQTYDTAENYEKVLKESPKLIKQIDPITGEEKLKYVFENDIAVPAVPAAAAPPSALSFIQNAQKWAQQQEQQD